MDRNVEASETSSGGFLNFVYASFNNHWFRLLYS